MPQAKQPQPAVINTLDVSLSGDVKSTGIAYKDEGESYEDFLSKVSDNENIIGFEWNCVEKKLGIILG